MNNEKKADAKVSIQYLSKYKKPSANGATTVFVYGVTGSPEAIARYEEVCNAEGHPARTDDASGLLMYFTTRHHGPKNSLTISGYSGKKFVENNELDIMLSVKDQVQDADVKSALATQIAQQLMANALGTAPSAPIAQSVEASAEEAVEETTEDPLA